MSGGGFKARVSPDGWVNGGSRLSVTHDNIRSQVVYFATRQQIEKTIAALQAWLDAHPEEQKEHKP